MAHTDTWMPLYIGAYTADTMHLSTTEHGAYLLLLIHGWRCKGRIVGNDRAFAEIVKRSLPQWLKMKPIIKPFFNVILIDGGLECWTQKRQLKEIKKANERSEQAGAAANVRWGNKHGVDADAYAGALPEHMRMDMPVECAPPLPPTNTHYPVINNPASIPEGMGIFRGESGSGGRVTTVAELEAEFDRLESADPEGVRAFPGAAAGQLCVFLGINSATAAKAKGRTDITPSRIIREWSTIFEDPALKNKPAVLAARLQLVRTKTRKGELKQVTT